MEIKMVRFSGAFLGTLVAGAAMVALGCPSLSSVQYFSDGYGGGTTMATTGTGGGVPCSPTVPCVDDNPCTTEKCTNGFCSHDPLTMDPGPGSNECMTISCMDGEPTTTVHDGKVCGKAGKLKCMGEVCTGCMVDTDCGPTDECQTSTCLPDKTCKFDPKPIGTKVTLAKLPNDLDGDCKSTVCTGTGTILLLNDDTDLPDDGVECTDGQCVKGTPGQVDSAVGASCSNKTTFCNSAHGCELCAIDANCAPGKSCYKGGTTIECVSCSDVVLNGDETDTDCGGKLCGNTCKDGKKCKSGTDCEHNLCTAGLCVGCFDGVQNNGEAGVDCGGPCALKCGNGTPCSNAGDCSSTNCMDGVCCNLSCTGTCTACNIPTKVGTCDQLDKGHDDLDPVCSGTKTCNASACVNIGTKKHYGEACNVVGDCFSGLCAGNPLTCN